jgi:DNA-binding IclR family transcriptional regulator
MTRAALAASRTIELLDFLAAHPDEQFSLSDLAKRLEVGVSSMHGLLGVMTRAGYLERHPRLRTYRLGRSTIAVGSAALEAHPAVDLARDAARRLAKEISLEVAVTTATGGDIVFLAHAGARRATGLAVHVGQRVPFVPPLGSVFVAWGDARDWLSEAADRAALQSILSGVRERGYSVALEVDARRGLSAALDEIAKQPGDRTARGRVLDRLSELAHTEYQIAELDDSRLYDVSMIAAPVFDDRGDVTLALTLLGFPPQLDASRVVQYGERVRDAGLIVTKQSRGRMPSAVDH